MPLTQKRSVQVFAGGLLLLLSILAFTNPKKEDYLSYTAEQIHLASEQGCQELDPEIGVSVFSTPTSELCDSFVQGADFLGRGVLKQLISLATEEPDNYLIFSVYTTTTPGRDYKTLGIGGRFFTLSAKW
ncbi:MAG: DUF4359 domain-containing protein [Leptolyngbyaceae cyanobacterium SM1_1_3]|nr:DUF4359 domain-containing protein [Leptolyngbyaceae cyanobacterium SM1_1_3]NJN02950.1 DUF4359 domain-containing protein [Leptolyngbyaceae cyanobacterium RM1_1_2]NJO08848.1 DUF4359 domain-containing protein [Leptolyngbyaceae cyanobacterium SL_1_1]